MINITIVVRTVRIGYSFTVFQTINIAYYYIAVRFDKNTGNPIPCRPGRSCGEAGVLWDISKWLSSSRSAGHGGNIMRLILFTGDLPMSTEI